MIIPDINLLLYAYDAASGFHAKAGVWWQGCLSGAEIVGFPRVVIFGFVRLATNRRAFQYPMTAAEAADHVRCKSLAASKRGHDALSTLFGRKHPAHYA